MRNINKNNEIKELSIIIPAYNEEKRIEKTLNTYITFLLQKYKKSFEIIIITDGCKDKTPKIVEKFSKKFKFIKHINPSFRLGKGGAIIRGLKIAKGKIVGFVDADGSTAPESILLMIENLSKYDAVIGSRWIKGAIINKKQPILRRIASRLFNFFVRILFNFNFKDTQCGAKFFKREVIKNIISELGLTDWAFDVDLLYRLNRKRYRIKEFPVVWFNKEGSKLNLCKTSVKMFLSIIGLRIKCSRFSIISKSPLVTSIYRKVKNL